MGIVFDRVVTTGRERFIRPLARLLEPPPHLFFLYNKKCHGMELKKRGASEEGGTGTGREGKSKKDVFFCHLEKRGVNFLALARLTGPLHSYDIILVHVVYKYPGPESGAR